MSQTITISLEEPEGIEDYGESDRNIMQVQVHKDAAGGCIVDLSLSREAMIGFATALLRAAHQPANNVSFVEMLPSDAGYAVERFGVFMHPKSCRLHLSQKDFGDISTLIANTSELGGGANSAALRPSP